MNPVSFVKADVEIDVSGCDALGRPLKIVVSIFLPPRDQLPHCATAVFAVPGGGYSRGYFDMRFEGHFGYSQAEHHVSRGVIFVSIDPLGVGESTPDVAAEISVAQIAAANNMAVRVISEQLAHGTLLADYPPVSIDCRIGIGQSMGGAVTIVMAGTHRTYDAVAILGFSAIHTQLPFPDGRDATRVAADVAQLNESAQADSLSVASTAALIPDFLYPFFWSDVPSDIINADTAGGYPLRQRSPDFGSLTVPTCAVTLLLEGCVAVEAAAISCPVFIGLGERDTAPQARSEPAAYRTATDVTLFICPTMAHMHNFASTRLRLWDRLVNWYAAVS